MDERNISAEILQLLSPEQAWHYSIIPFDSTDTSISFYLAENGNNTSVKDELELIFNKRVHFKSLAYEDIQKMLVRFYRRGNAHVSGSRNFELKSLNSFNLESLIEEALSLDCSDIHFEALEDKCHIRYRIDGRLLEKYVIQRTEYPSLINKIKIQANLDIAEKRLPQDGRIKHLNDQTKVDIRVSILPTLYGEKAVLRLLNKDTTDIDINKIGMSEIQLKDYIEGIKKPNGFVLISGPTGSGKTTTLYASLKLLNQPDINILTIEDPIEYTLSGINQVQLNEKIGMDFTHALRTFLRQDPDIIMVGEIRDKPTAEMAIRASLTGHLVLSTIHTNSAWGTISRLIDMGIPPFLLANTLNLSIAQRLVRRLCPLCKKETDIKQYNLHVNTDKLDSNKIFEAVGCEECFYTGYKGRAAIFEVISINSAMSNLIKQSNVMEDQIYSEFQILTLKDSALRLFLSGRTSFDEISQFF